MEALAIVGFTSNVVQFIQFGGQLCKEIHAYSSAFGRAPQKILDIEERVTLVLKTLINLEDDARVELDHEKRTIEDCTAKITELLAVLEKLKLAPRPLEGKATSREWLHRSLNRIEVGWKAFKALIGDEKTNALQLSLDRLLALLKLQLQIKANRKITDGLEAIIQSIERLDLDVQKEQKIYEQVGERGVKHIIPFLRNAKFIGRQEDIKKLEERFNLGERQVALCGLGGVGKTQVALEYALRLKERSPEVSVFWIFASNVSRFEDAYKQIASICGIPGHQDPNTNILQIVHDWLGRTYPCKWLMIIDNVDNAHEFFESQLFGKAMHQYVPHSPNGSILYTTRDRDIAVDLVSDRDPIQIDCLTLEEADQLLNRYLRDAGTSEERQGLLQALGFLPLAITQAVAFMAKRRKTIAQYLELFEKNTIAKARLLTYEFIDHGREARALDSVARTWMVSFDLIKSTQSRAADLLSLMSFLDPQSIHPSLLLDDGEDEWDLSDALETLVALSLIKINENDGTYSMHRLVQVVTCSWLLSSNADDHHKFALQTLSMLAKRFPNDNTIETAAIMYIPHADTILSSETQKISRPYQLSQATLLHKTAGYYSRFGHLVIAEVRARAAHDLRTEFLGQFHRDTVVSLSTLGWINNRLCRYHVAQEIVEPVLHVLLNDGTFPVGPMRGLTDVLTRALIGQKQLEFAEQLVRKVVPDHMIDGLATDSLQSPPSGDLEGYLLIVTLGKIHLQKGDFKKAEDYYQKALILYQTAFEKYSTDDNYIATPKAMSNIRNGILVATGGLAQVQSHQNRHSQAELLYRKLLTESESTYGSSGLGILIVLSHLALALEKQEKWDEAEAVWQRLCRDSEAVLGSWHEHTIWSQKGYARMLQMKPEEDELERWMDEFADSLKSGSTRWR